MKYTSIPKLLAMAQMYLQNATENTEIQKKMNMHGFTPKHFQEGKTLLGDTKQHYSRQNDKYGEKKELTGQIKEDEKKAKQTLSEHMDIVTFAFRKDPVTLAKFDIKRVASKPEDWTLQATLFYDKALAYVDVLAQHGLTQEDVAQAIAMVEAIMTIRNRRTQRKGEAEEATRTRNQSVKALEAWMKDFRAAARHSLKDSPQLLEAVGIIVK